MSLALALLTAYGVLALGLRMLIQLRRTGSTGFRGLGGATTPAEWLGGVLLVVGIGLVVAGALPESEDLDRLGVLDGEVARAAGAGLAAGGMVATLAAQLAMGDAWRIGVDPSERTDLVTGGPFAVVRNPIYAGMIPFFFGIALLDPNALALAGALSVLIALELQTRLVEEPYLARTHGEAYTRYASRVGRFLPGVGRLRA